MFSNHEKAALLRVYYDASINVILVLIFEKEKNTISVVKSIL